MVGALADVGRTREAAALDVLVDEAGDAGPLSARGERRFGGEVRPVRALPAGTPGPAARASALTEAVEVARRAPGSGA